MNNTRKIAYAGLLAALYVALTYAQNFLLPGTTSMAIQFRASEALCVMAFYSPSAIWGLTVGCLLFNISNAGALPLDWLVGTLATFLATGAMYLTRKVAVKMIPFLWVLWGALTTYLIYTLTYINAGLLECITAITIIGLTAFLIVILNRKVTIKNIPFLGLLMPAIFNALLVGWELTFYIGGGFWINALYVALGELGVLLTLGVILHVVMTQRGLDKKLSASAR